MCGIGRKISRENGEPGASKVDLNAHVS